KRGLVPNAEAGYPLVEHTPVVLEVDESFEDAHGRPLRTGARQLYEVGPDIRRRVVPEEWEWQLPPAGSIAPLVARFDRPLDHALAGRCIRLADRAGGHPPGAAEVEPGDGAWRFLPTEPWSAGHYTVVVDGRLEDTAGNSVARVFDRDLLLR